MICDGCQIDRTVVVIWRDYRGRITKRCRACNGGEVVDEPKQAEASPTATSSQKTAARKPKMGQH